MRCLPLVLAAALAVPAAAQVRAPSPAHQPGEKTLLHFGWSTPGVDFLLDHSDQLDASPFDGIVFHFGPDRWLEAIAYPALYDRPILAFADRPWTADELRLDELGDVAWGGMENSFVAQLGQSFDNLDWFDDAHWAVVTANAELVSQAVAAGGARGVMLDPEHYGFADYNMWRYFPWAFPDRTYPEVEVAVRQRGAEYVQALQSARPEMTVITLFGLGWVYANVEANGGIEGADYGLLAAFLNGMLDAAAPGLALVDGNEGTYYIDETSLFTGNYDYVRYQATSLLDPVHRPAWQRQHQASYAVYADYPLFFDWGHPADFQLDWFEHNVYHALLTTDAFVWIYDEELNWYNEPELGWARYVPEGVEARIASARAKLAGGEALGFDLAKPGALWFDPSVAADRVTSPAVTIAFTDGRPAAGRPFGLRADVGGPASRVSFFANGAFVGDDTSAPFEVTVRRLGKGTEAVTVWARADTGPYQHVTSPPVTVPLATPRALAAALPDAELRLTGPNPARGAPRLAVTLPAAGPARLDVVDALGRTVAVLADGELPAGESAFALGGALAPGVYTARLRAGDAVHLVRFTVVR